MPSFKARAPQRGSYVPRGSNVLTAIFKNHFEDFKENYQSKLEDTSADCRLEHIVKQVEGLLVCGLHKRNGANTMYKYRLQT